MKILFALMFLASTFTGIAHADESAQAPLGVEIPSETTNAQSTATPTPEPTPAIDRKEAEIKHLEEYAGTLKKRFKKNEAENRNIDDEYIATRGAINVLKKLKEEEKSQ